MGAAARGSIITSTLQLQAALARTARHHATQHVILHTSLTGVRTLPCCFKQEAVRSCTATELDVNHNTTVHLLRWLALANSESSLLLVGGVESGCSSAFSNATLQLQTAFWAQQPAHRHLQQHRLLLPCQEVLKPLLSSTQSQQPSEPPLTSYPWAPQPAEAAAPCPNLEISRGAEASTTQHQ